MISFRSTFQPNALPTRLCTLVGQLKMYIGTYRLNVSINPWDNPLCDHVRFFTLAHIAFFNKPFWLIVPKSYSSLYFVRSPGHCHHHHHHHVVPPARISLTLSRHFSLSFIASGRSSGLHPVSSQSRCMYVRAGRFAFARPYVGVQRSTSLMSSSLHL